MPDFFTPDVRYVPKVIHEVRTCGCGHDWPSHRVSRDTARHYRCMRCKRLCSLPDMRQEQGEQR